MKKLIVVVLVVFAFSFALSGCYSATRNQMQTAQKLISDLKAQGGEQKAPYEYWSAEKYLEVSGIEFNETGYGPAKEFADRSIAAAQAGLAKVRGK